VHPRVVSIDRNPVTLPRPTIDFVTGDLADVASLLADRMPTLEHPFLVIEDAHTQVETTLHFFHPYLEAGDYLIVEDSLPKREVLTAFLGRRPGAYALDTLYTDLFGENTTCAIDSILRRNAGGSRS
jgi:cephalosporin hydroxylase